jgi:hypothetical protein
LEPAGAALALDLKVGKKERTGDKGVVVCATVAGSLTASA